MSILCEAIIFWQNDCEDTIFCSFVCESSLFKCQLVRNKNQ